MSKQMSDSSKGFTIVELLIAVTIIAIGASFFLVTSNRELKRERINAAVIGLTGWIEEARRAALRGGTACTVSITAGTYSYSPSPSTGVIATASPASSCQPSKTGYKLPDRMGSDRIRVDTGANLTFSTLGTLYSTNLSYPSSEIVLSLLSPSGVVERSRCIRIGGLMGSIEIGNRNSGSCNYATRF